MTSVEQLTQQAWQTPYSTRVDSITNFQHTYAQEDDLVVQDLIKGASTLSNKAINKIRDIALQEPLLVHRLISPEAHVTAVNVTLHLPGIDMRKEVPEVMNYARQVANQLRAENPQLDIYLTGMAAMNNAFSEAAMLDMKTLVPASYGVILICVLLLLRRMTATLGVFLVIIFSILTAMGIAGWRGVGLTAVSASAPTMILTLAVANAVHILVTFLYGLRTGNTKKAAMSESLRINLQPIFLTSLTTTLGFLSMNFSATPPHHDLGNTVAVGVLASFLLSITFLPALMTLLPVRPGKVQPNTNPFMLRFADFVIRRRTGLLWGMGLLILTFVALIPRNEVNDVFTQFFDSRVQFRVDSDFASENLGGLYRVDYSLKSGSAGGVSDPAFLRQVDAFANWYRQQPGVVHVNTLTDTFKRLNKNMHGDDATWYRLPKQRELAAQYLLLYEMSLPYGLDLNNQLNVDKSATRMNVGLRTLSVNQLLALEASAQAWLKDNAPQMQVAGSSPTVMFSHIGKRNIYGMITGTSIALVLISLLLIFALRSVKIGLISLIPNLVPAAIGFGIWGVLIGEIGMALATVVSMTLGIVVDDTIHFLSKYLRARREKGCTSSEAVRYAFSTIGTALWVTSAVLIAGFIVLAFSAFKLNAHMGLLTAIIIAVALAADFLFLPALLMLIDKKSEKPVPHVTVQASTP